MRIYSIYDRASGLYDSLLLLPADASATRIFLEACGDSRSPISKYPTDYELWYLGELDTTTGVISPSQSMVIRGVKPEPTNG